MKAVSQSTKCVREAVYSDRRLVEYVGVFKLMLEVKGTLFDYGPLTCPTLSIVIAGRV